MKAFNMHSEVRGPSLKSLRGRNQEHEMLMPAGHAGQVIGINLGV